MRGLLDTDLLSGTHEITMRLRPERAARPVDAGHLGQLRKEIIRLCQTWGGAGQPILPIVGGEVPPAYVRLLQVEQVDQVGGLHDVDAQLPYRVRRSAPRDFPVIVIADSTPRDQWRPVHVPTLDVDDPWELIYAATLGVLPEVPDPALMDPRGHVDNVRFEQIMPVERQRVIGSLDDLLQRLENRQPMSPRMVSNIGLAAGQEPDTGYMGRGASPLPQPYGLRRAAGPNIVVVVSPGSVEDLALLWNLRAAHGDGRVMPIGLPVAAVTEQALKELRQPGRASMFGFQGGRCFVTSASRDPSQLADVAASAGMRAVAYEELLTFGPPPGRGRNDIAQWSEGQAQLAVVSEADREFLRPTRNFWRPPELVVDVSVRDQLLPADPTMRGAEFGLRFQAGSAQVHVPSLRRLETVAVHMPSTWTSFAAVAQSRRLRVEPSEPGLAAETLIRAIGGVEGIRYLTHRPLIELLYKLAERSGMAWWKDRWTRTHRELRALGVPEEEIEAAAVRLGRDDPAIAPPGEGRALPFSDFLKVFRKRQAAVNWVVWAERHHLLVRGATVECPACKAKSWLPMASVPPPVACPGCGRSIVQPYEPEVLKFTYRIGEALRRVLETDSLGHLLALRWLVQLFERHGLVGAHPGVNFFCSDKNIGEADVVLLFADGSLVPVEVKRRIAGVDLRMADSLDTLSDALRAPYDIVAVTQPARDCPELLQFAHSLPDRPRLLLTDDQLHAEHAIFMLNSDPFAWEPQDENAQKTRQDQFVDLLVRDQLTAPLDWVSEQLLACDPS
ncbi:hypothetical protein [Micromonospora sp. CB01531]|uniref:hypothetical protein n=1 Tax=Micromonospora sp. CB01531 TaxID=1718947 RepID=UPI00093EE50A|nr:hypothetical protein [Micromonospora sp. CB01531]